MMKLYGSNTANISGLKFYYKLHLKPNLKKMSHKNQQIILSILASETSKGVVKISKSNELVKK